MYLKFLNMMNANAGEDYVRDGLIFQLDGTNKGNHTGEWQDLVSGMRFTRGTNVIEGNNYFQFDGGSTNDSLMLGSGSISTNVPTNKAAFTFEAVVESSGLGDINITFSGGQGSGISFVLRGASVWVFGQGYGYNAGNMITSSGIKVISYSTTRFILNRAIGSYAGNDYWGNGGQIASIGGELSATSRRFAGKVYAIRMYNRLLTENEMLHNQELDYKKFVL